MLPTLNTGPARSVTGHFISGSLTAAVLAGSIAYKSGKKASFKKSVKIAVQSGAAAASAIAATNYIGQGRYLNAALSIAVGVSSLYIIEKITTNKGKLDE